MRYEVTSVSFDLTRGEGVMAVAQHERTEVVDTVTNSVFTGCRGPWDVEDMYEAYWNRLNAGDEQLPGACTHVQERVKVVRVKQLD